MTTSMFKTIPSDNRTSFTYAVELDGSNANTAESLKPALIIGQKMTAGSATAGVPVSVTNKTDADAFFGQGSQASLMVQKYIAVDSFGTLSVLPFADAANATASSSTVAVTGTATAAGVIALYINGVSVPVAVASGDLASAVATNIAAAVTANADLPVTAGASSGTATFTAKCKGIAAGEVNLELNRYGRANNEIAVPGLTLTTSYTAGSIEPVLTTALAALGEVDYPFVVNPYTSTAQINAVKAYFDTAFNWQNQRYGCAFTAFKGTLSAVSTFGAGRNAKTECVLDASNAPEAAYIWATALTAAVAQQVRADPALPLHETELALIAPSVVRMKVERNTLLYTGISPVQVSDSGAVRTDRVITSYQDNEAGSPDDSWLDVETIYTIKAINEYIGTQTKSIFSKKKLVDDGAVIIGGQNVTSARVYKGYLAGWLRDLADQFLIQNVKTVIKNTRVTNIGNGKLAVYLPADLANQLREIDMKIAFRKS